MIHLSKSLTYYKRLEIQERLAQNSLNREIAARYNDRFGKRPDTIQHPADVLDLAKNGVTSLHVSEERWLNPLLIRTEMSRKELDDLRIGWDLILDVDCINFKISQAIARLIVEELQGHGIKSISVKFSGNKGFHIGVPYEAFPEKVGNKVTKDWFPEGPRKIALYLIDRLKSKITLSGEYVHFGKVMQIKKDTLRALGAKDFFIREGIIEKVNPESLMQLDTLLISSRHLYRMAYSLHEKSGLASIPIDAEEIIDFDKDKAKPENVKGDKIFLDSSKSEMSEAKVLFREAFDYSPDIPKYKIEETKEYEIPDEAIPEKNFPPCIHKLLAGVEDGRKRALFILINFLSTAGWDAASIEKKVNEWNSKNKEPLHQTYVNSQLRYQKYQKKKMPPPNCHNPAYYSDLRIKCSEDICSKVKNPIIYAKRAAASEENKKA